MDINERIAKLQKEGKTKRGKKELLKHYKGEQLTCRQAILAQCYACMGYYDGMTEEDCEDTTCPLYQHNPYGTMKASKKRRRRNPDGTEKISRRERRKLEKEQKDKEQVQEQPTEVKKKRKRL